MTDRLGLAAQPRAIGFEDGVIVPPDEFPLGTPASRIRGAAAERAPLQGVVRVIVVLVDFSDKAMTETAKHFEDLFFSTGVLPNGSVKDYFRETSHGLVDITGAVVGPYRMPQTLAWYANGNFGIGKPSGTTRARNMANDAAVAADPAVDFKPYDNDGNGFVDAFIVVHAGAGGEQTGNSGDIWSHKWVLPSTYTTDATKIFAYLTIPEDAKIGVSAHELGHLLFGWPDLYDTDDTSEGIGNWCLMAGGSWKQPDGDRGRGRSSRARSGSARLYDRGPQGQSCRQRRGQARSGERQRRRGDPGRRARGAAGRRGRGHAAPAARRPYVLRRHHGGAAPRTRAVPDPVSASPAGGDQVGLRAERD